LAHLQHELVKFKNEMKALPSGAFFIDSVTSLVENAATPRPINEVL
jgi:hypothetical protein